MHSQLYSHTIVAVTPAARPLRLPAAWPPRLSRYRLQHGHQDCLQHGHQDCQQHGHQDCKNDTGMPWAPGRRPNPQGHLKEAAHLAFAATGVSCGTVEKVRLSSVRAAARLERPPTRLPAPYATAEPIAVSCPPALWGHRVRVCAKRCSQFKRTKGLLGILPRRVVWRGIGGRADARTATTRVPRRCLTGKKRSRAGKASSFLPQRRPATSRSWHFRQWQSGSDDESLDHGMQTCGIARLANASP